MSIILGSATTTTSAKGLDSTVSTAQLTRVRLYSLKVAADLYELMGHCVGYGLSAGQV